jgi:hypothetical protein
LENLEKGIDPVKTLWQQGRGASHNPNPNPTNMTTIQLFTVDLNVGLDIPTQHGGGQHPVAVALAAVAQHVGPVQQFRVAVSATEVTLVARCAAPGIRRVQRRAIHRLAAALQQDCVACVPCDGSAPYLAGPNAAAWGKFAARFWLSVA